MLESHPRLPRSVRKFLHREKARLRRTVAEPAEAERRIGELLAGIRGRFGRLPL